MGTRLFPYGAFKPHYSPVGMSKSRQQTVNYSQAFPPYLPHSSEHYYFHYWAETDRQTTTTLVSSHYYFTCQNLPAWFYRQDLTHLFPDILGQWVNRLDSDFPHPTPPQAWIPRLQEGGGGGTDLPHALLPHCPMPTQPQCNLS